MAKITFQSQIAKDLFIVDQFIDSDGLTIQYIYQGKELEISLDIYDAAELLAKYGVVPAACNGRVLVEYEDEFFKYMDFSEYARMNRLDHATAREMAIGEESERTMMPALNNVKKIPSVFDTIFANLYSPTKPAL